MTDHISAAVVVSLGLIFNLAAVSSPGLEAAPFPSAESAEKLSSQASTIEGEAERLAEELGVELAIEPDCHEKEPVCEPEEIHKQIGRIKGLADHMQKQLDR